MLPKILDIAEQHGVQIEPRSYGKKETLAKCPFCLEDANKVRYYLSLNTQDNVYKCWYCKVRGGVLDFESRLTGVPYPDIKEKYFGKSKRPIHPAELLNSNQLDLIGCNQRMDKKKFREQREIIYRQWLNYEEYQLSELFAELLVISNLQDKKRQYELLIYIKERCDKSQIKLCYGRIIEEYKKIANLKRDQSPSTIKNVSSWAVDGLFIARLAYRIARSNNDLEYTKVVLKVPLLHSLYMKEKENLKLTNQGLQAR